MKLLKAHIIPLLATSIITLNSFGVSASVNNRFSPNNNIPHKSFDELMLQIKRNQSVFLDNLKDITVSQQEETITVTVQETIEQKETISSLTANETVIENKEEKKTVSTTNTVTNQNTSTNTTAETKPVNNSQPVKQEAPKSQETPKVEAPKKEEPKVEEKKTEAPKAEEQKTQAPAQTGKYIGTISMPAVGLSQSLYTDDANTSAQKIVDNQNSAYYGYYYSGNVIVGDHVDQGFYKIKNSQVGQEAYVNGTRYVVAAVILNAKKTSDRYHMTFNDGTYIESKYKNCVLVYTCNSNAFDISIVVLQKPQAQEVKQEEPKKEEQVEVKEEKTEEVQQTVEQAPVETPVEQPTQEVSQQPTEQVQQPVQEVEVQQEVQPESQLQQPVEEQPVVEQQPAEQPVEQPTEIIEVTE